MADPIPPPPPPGFQVVPSPPPGFQLVPAPVLDRFAPTIAFESMLDRKTGAPASVREMVGSAPWQDRLAQIQQVYPDAQPFEDDNFVFSDPVTGRPTLYNEQNPTLLGIGIPTLGDLASVTRDATMLAGGTLGGAAAVGGTALTAIPTGGGSMAASLLTVPAAVGAGTAGAASLYDFLRGLRGGIDTRDLGEVATDSATDFLVGAAGQRVADLAPSAVRAFLGGTRSRLAGASPTEVAGDAAASGVRLTAGQATGNRMLQGFEQAAAKMPTGAARMQQFFHQQLDDLGKRLEQVASGYGTGTSATEAGRAVQRGATDFVGGFQKTAGDLYDEVGRRIPSVALLPMPGTQAALAGPLARFASNPAFGASLVNPKFKGWADALQKGGALTFDELKEFRSYVGRQLSDPMTISDIPRADWKTLYGGISADLEAAARAQGPEAFAAFQRANRYYQAGLQRIEGTIDRVLKADTPERAYQLAMVGSEGRAGGATGLYALRRSMPQEDWGAVSAFTLRRMGMATPGQQGASGDLFSPATFLTNLNRLSPDARAALFGGTPYDRLSQDLVSLARSAGAIKDTAAMANPSGTAGAGSFMRMLQPFAYGGMAGGVAGYPTTGAFLIGALDLIPPYAASRLLTNEKFVRWAVAGSRIRSNEPQSLLSHLSRLTALDVADPALKQYWDTIQAAARGAPAPTSGDETATAPPQ